MKVSPIQKLDHVLGILAEGTSNTSVAKIVLKSKEKISGTDTLFVLDKLVKDGYVNHLGGNLPANVTINTALSYSITFEGLVFHQQGGYTAENQNNKRKAKREKVYIIAVGVGTALAGVYGFFEIARWIFHHFHWQLPF